MKKFFNLIFIVFIIFSLDKLEVNAEGEKIDMSNFKFDMLTDYADGTDDVKVSKFVSSNGEVAFCLEPTTQYRPDKYKYRKYIFDNEKIYDLVRAYNLLENKTDDLYIATQLLIWSEINDISYTFDNYDYKKEKEIVLNNINYEIKPKLLKSNINNSFDVKLNEEFLIEGNYTNYNIETEGIEILNNSENGLLIKVISEEPTTKYIYLNEIEDKKNNSILLKSNGVGNDLGSQDLYYHEGDYPVLDKKIFKINIIKDEYFKINYSKRDIYGNNISNALFTLYQISDEQKENEIIFININTDIDLYKLLIDDYEEYSNLSVDVGERYNKYLNKNVINTNELGYFDCRIYSNQDLLVNQRIYVSNDSNENAGIYKKVYFNNFYNSISKDIDINTIENIPLEGKYYLCESEPAKGYTYVHNPCSLIDSNEYKNETINFVNERRRYSLRLIKNNRNDIVLNNAKFKVTYFDNEKENTVFYTTGGLSIDRINNNKYLFIKHDHKIEKYDFVSDKFVLNNADAGKYYYYQSNNEIFDENELKECYEVVEGGFIIDDLPYSSKLIIEELEAPKGYMITEAKYEIYPDINYSEITFSNYRVNEFEILPAKKRKLPKTCVEN